MHGVIDVAGAERDVLDAFAVIGDQVFLDLTLVVRALVDRNPYLSTRAGHRLAFEPRQLPLDVEIADLAEIEQPFVEARPFVHPAAMHVVRQMVDRHQPRALRTLPAPAIGTKSMS
jgi:hypothetical protein